MLYPAELRDLAGDLCNAPCPVWEAVSGHGKGPARGRAFLTRLAELQAASSAATSSSAFSPVGARLAFLERYSSSSFTA